MDLDQWVYRIVAIITASVGAAWTLVKLYFGVRKLHREDRVAGAFADVQTTRAQMEAVKIRDSVMDEQPAPKTPTIPSLLPPSSSVFDEDNKNRGGRS